MAPHPDDETLGAAGLIAYQRAAGVPVTVIAVTDGEAAYPGVAGLAAVRAAEQADALERLGGGRLIRLRLADGLVEREEGRLVEALCRRINRETLLVAPFEHDGHPDHDACGTAARRAAMLSGARLARYPIWAWHWSPPSVFATARLACLELDQPRRHAKRSAIAAHRSQTDRTDGEPILSSEVLTHFERAQEVFLLDDEHPNRRRLRGALPRRS